MDMNSKSGPTRSVEESESNMSPLPLTMSAELKAGDVKIVVLAHALNELDILPTLGSTVNFLSKLKESLTLPLGSEWTISFAADQTYRLQSYSGRTTGQPELELSDTLIGAPPEGSPLQSEMQFPKVG